MIGGQNVRRPREDLSRTGVRCLSSNLRFHPFDVGAELAQLFVEMFVATIDVIDAAHFRRTSAFNPASTSAADARRSLAITGAPVSRSTP